MQGLSMRDPEVLGALTLLGLGLGGFALYIMTRKKPSAEQVERERRLELVKTGRIIDGTVIDIADVTEAESGHAGGLQLIIYKYEIAGVVYECSQDVSALKNFVDLYQCRLGFPCSVRYDSHQPSNSIVVAENWSGFAGYRKAVSDAETDQKSGGGDGAATVSSLSKHTRFCVYMVKYKCIYAKGRA